MALILGGLVLLLAAARIPLLVVGHQNSLTSTIQALAIAVPFAGIGVLVARRRPGNVIGWLIVAPALCFLLGTDAGLYAAIRYRLGYGLPAGPVALLLYQAWLPAFALFPLAILLFPEGRLPSSRWHWVLRSYLGLCGVLLAVVVAGSLPVMLDGHIRVDANGQLLVFDHPSGWVSRSQLPIFAAFIGCWLAFVTGQVLAWRRARDERRQQLKWLIAGATVCLACAGVSIALGGHQGSAKALSDVFAVGVVALPAGIGGGILKYRLYDLDRLISRTLAYAIVTGLLVGVYAGLVLLATEVMRVHSSVAVAVSTLAAAALFNPLRRRVQQAVDRRFNRARYDADQAVGGGGGPHPKKKKKDKRREQQKHQKKQNQTTTRYGGRGAGLGARRPDRRGTARAGTGPCLRLGQPAGLTQTEALVTSAEGRCGYKAWVIPTGRTAPWPGRWRPSRR